MGLHLFSQTKYAASKLNVIGEVSRFSLIIISKVCQVAFTILSTNGKQPRSLHHSRLLQRRPHLLQ
uniref:AAA family ATPase n=1 Tax=Rhizophora mucronata TaxID=61149 RepID=A0A2P2MVW1_RHIMU